MYNQKWEFYTCRKCERVCDEVNVRWKKVTYHANGTASALCSDCLKSNTVGVPDVWYGYGSGTHTEENICNPETGQPIPFHDKASKAAAMKIAGVREAGDTHHGARTTFQGGRHN